MRRQLQDEWRRLDSTGRGSKKGNSSLSSSPSLSTSGRRDSAAMNHLFGWRDFFDIAVRWRYYIIYVCMYVLRILNYSTCCYSGNYLSRMIPCGGSIAFPRKRLKMDSDYRPLSVHSPSPPSHAWLAMPLLMISESSHNHVFVFFISEWSAQDGAVLSLLLR